MLAGVKRKTQEELVDGWRMVETYIWVESALKTVIGGYEILQCSLDDQISLGKSSALLGSRV